MQLLVISNGHGEDEVAMRIVRELQCLPTPPNISALPIVGTGQAYQRQRVPIVGPVQVMPSGGFVYMDLRQLFRDLGGGLLSLTWGQLQALWSWAREGDAILAVGDIVPLLFAWWSGVPYAFVGTAKSDYYLRDEAGSYPQLSGLQRFQPSVYPLWDRWFMQDPRCRAVFPRDHLTSDRLQHWPIPVFDVGNPMMDQLAPQGKLPLIPLGLTSALTVTLLPGSRPPEVYENWAVILAAIAGLLNTSSQPWLFLAAIVPNLDLQIFHAALHAQHWQRQAMAVEPQDLTVQTFVQAQATLLLTQRAFNDCVHAADVVIAMAGTATEQCVGLGKPVITLPGAGPQFTPKFAQAQARFLGPSVTLVQAPEQVPAAVHHWGLQPQQRQEWQENGDRRMGPPGAARRIALCLQQELLRGNGARPR